MSLSELPEGRRLSTRRAYSGRVISLDVDVVRYPNGSTGELEMVRHPGASAVVPFLDDPAGADPRIVMIRQYRYAAGGYLLEIPAGRLDEDETPIVCALRELQEETGHTAAAVELLATFYTTPGFTDERIHLFMASGLSPGKLQLDADETVEPAVLTISEALAKVRIGEIVDGKSIVALFLASEKRLEHRSGPQKPPIPG